MNRMIWYVGITDPFDRTESRPRVAVAFHQPLGSNDRVPGYVAMIGPFRTRRGAQYMADYGAGNPHVQTVNAAERIARELANGPIGYRFAARSIRRPARFAFPHDYNWVCPVCLTECRAYELTCSHCEHLVRMAVS